MTMGWGKGKQQNTCLQYTIPIIVSEKGKKRNFITILSDCKRKRKGGEIITVLLVTAKETKYKISTEKLVTSSVYHLAL